MSIPRQIDPAGTHDYLAIMTRAVFQAGVSWALVAGKWPAFERNFEGFNPVIVAAFDETDIARIAEDPDMLRSARKIRATVKNARTMLELEKLHGSFAAYLRSFGSYEERSSDIQRRFAYVGELSVYYLLFRVREPVPPFDELEKTAPGDHPRMREMVALARSET